MTRNQILNSLNILLKEFWYAPMDAYLRSFEVPIWNKIKFKSPVLDIGCGDGRIDNFLFKGKSFDVGLDPSGKAINEAKYNKLYKKAIQAKAEKMPFKDKSFNTIVLNSTFEHIKGDIKAVKEISRVLKKGGHLYFTTTTSELKKEIYRIFNNKKLFDYFNKRVEHRHYRNLEEWKSIVLKYGMVVESSHFYFSNYDLKVWLILFRLFTFKINNRELWSYLKDSKISKYLPSNTIYLSEYFIIKILINRNVNSTGLWQFVSVRKI